MEEDDGVFTYVSLSLSPARGSASAAEPPGCSSPSLSLLDGVATTLLLLLLAPERLRFGTRLDELALPARARFFALRLLSAAAPPSWAALWEG